VALMENLVQTIGWKLDYKALETATKPQLKDKNESKAI
ncbi:MAG TPA: DUF4230 domain-containing protein, partial [Leeuwenhoekiella sp.]|nr:DUF4230 domain-containing protein [Leeuwenhoekiella sp.]